MLLNSVLSSVAAIVFSVIARQDIIEDPDGAGWIMIVLLIAGCFLDNAVAVILLTPIFVAVIQALNIDICYFGVFLVFVLAIGQVTPPVGLCLFVACDMAKTTIEAVSKEVVPYIIGLVAVAVLLIFAPQIIMWLPGLAGL